MQATVYLKLKIHLAIDSLFTAVYQHRCKDTGKCMTLCFVHDPVLDPASSGTVTCDFRVKHVVVCVFYVTRFLGHMTTGPVFTDRRRRL